MSARTVGEAGLLARLGLEREAAALGELVRFICPLLLGALCGVVADRWTIAFVGHWDKDDISHYDGASIGKVYSNITGLSLGVSSTIGLATLASQAHGAGRSKELNPVFLRRCWLLLTAAFLFTLASGIFCEPILLGLHQVPAVAHTSALFAQTQLVGIPFFWVSNSINIVLNSAKSTLPGLVSSALSSISQLLFSFVLTCPSMGNMGYLGVAWGRSLGGFVNLFSIVAMVKIQGLEHIVWRRLPNSEPLLRKGAVCEYLAVSIPSALVVWSEWWAFEVLALMVGLLPNPELNLAAHGTMFNVIVVFYMCWTSACTAVCALVGNLLGARRNDEIRPVLRAAFFFSAVTAALVAVFYEAAKGLVAAFFTENEGAQALIRSSSIGLVLSVPCYAMLMTFYGALRGANKQKAGILGTLVGYWVVGLPAGGVLGVWWHWPTPLVGVWIGNVIALAIAASWVCGAVFWRIDWLNVRRVEEGSNPLLQEDGQHRGGDACEIQAVGAGPSGEQRPKPLEEEAGGEA